MRGSTLGRRVPFSPAKHSPFLSSASSPFSTSSGRGRGRGFGGAGDGSSSSGPRQFDFTARALGKPDSDDSKPDSSESPPSGLGHGRGKPILPTFSSFVSSVKSAQSGIGRGQVTNESGTGRPSHSHREPVPASTEFTRSEKPNLSSGESRPESAPPRMQFTRSQEPNLSSGESRPESLRTRMRFTRPEEPNLPSGILSNLTGAGRGKPIKPEAPTPQTMGENRHIRAQPKPKPVPAGPEKVRPKMSMEEAVKKTVSILSRGGDGPAEVARPGGGRGRGMGKGRGRGRGRDGGGRGRRWGEDSEEGFPEGLYLGDNPDGGEKLAERVGAEVMNKLTEGFEELGERVLPSPLDDAYLDALHTNYMIEFEPEYLMGEFDQNPDIDEKPPMPLRDVLEKVKPFLMAYEGIQSQEEWEEAVEETMKNVPLLKEIVDYYSGPDRVTAKKQQEELESIAKTIPASAPASVKQFTDRAVLSLQSNPGWEFDKKYQFMDKLVREVSKHYN